jgi:hypothetical protein
MSDNVYAKISEKMKNERFTDEEIKTVEKAKEQLSSYSKHFSSQPRCIDAGSGIDLAGTEDDGSTDLSHTLFFSFHVDQ